LWAINAMETHTTFHIDGNTLGYRWMNARLTMLS
jgi:hypothetical protein